VIALPGSTPAAQAAKAASANIPIIFGVGGDPIKLGLVSSLNRPGGNLTGVTVLAVELAPKQLQLLHELMPTMTAVAVLINPTSPALAETTLRDLHAATRTLGVQLHVVHASTDSDLDTAFAYVANLRIGGLIIGSDAFFTSQVQKLARLATHHRISAVYWNRDFANAGGLMSYGTNPTDMYRIAGVYTGRILRGESVAELPVQQNTKIELMLNIKTARQFGITFPLPLLGRADEVVE
jgi:putative ABC transport system substrate-binding protein